TAKPKRTRAKSKSAAEQAGPVEAERPAAPAGRAKTDRVLFLVDRARDEGAREIALSGRNLAHATVLGHAEASVHAVLGHDRGFVTKNAYEALAEVCGA